MAFEPEVITQLEPLLPSFLVSRRWFRAKARPMKSVAVDDVVPFSSADLLLVLHVNYVDGGMDTYLLPVSMTSAADDSIRNAASTEPMARLRASDGTERLLYSAFSNPSFRSALLAAIAENKSFKGRKGEFIASRTAGSGVSADTLDPAMDSAVSRAEQSNTSVVYGDKFILKLFRKVEEGLNPDVEVGVFLTEHGFANTPPVIGTLEYQSHDGSHRSHAAGLLGSYVPNVGDAWKFSLDALSGFFGRALAGGKQPENVPSEHLYSEMGRQADAAFSVLHAKLSSLSAAARSEAEELLAKEDDLRARFAHLRDSKIDAARIRFHGDYHLGQVLYTGSDFMIIDFEGEPARPLEERREKSFALRDVAGMVRSFQYAAYAALFGQVAGVELTSVDPELLVQWAAFWYAWVSAAFLKGYFETGGNAVFLAQIKASIECCSTRFYCTRRFTKSLTS